MGLEELLKSALQPEKKEEGQPESLQEKAFKSLLEKETNAIKEQEKKQSFNNKISAFKDETMSTFVKHYGENLLTENPELIEIAGSMDDNKFKEVYMKKAEQFLKMKELEKKSATSQEKQTPPPVVTETKADIVKGGSVTTGEKKLKFDGSSSMQSALAELKVPVSKRAMLAAVMIDN